MARPVEDVAFSTVEPRPTSKARIHTHHNMTEEVTVLYRLSVSYSNLTADMEYTLTEYHERENGERRVSCSWNGSKAWAERHSKHYGIEMPKEKK